MEVQQDGIADLDQRDLAMCCVPFQMSSESWSSGDVRDGQRLQEQTELDSIFRLVNVLGVGSYLKSSKLCSTNRNRKDGSKTENRIQQELEL